MTVYEALTESQYRIIREGMRDKSRSLDKELEDLDTIAELTVLLRLLFLILEVHQ